MFTHKFAVVIEQDNDGYFTFCPELDGCFTQGNTYEEAVNNIKDAIKLHIEDRLADNDPIPQVDKINLISMEVVV